MTNQSLEVKLLYNTDEKLELWNSIFSEIAGVSLSGQNDLTYFDLPSSSQMIIFSVGHSLFKKHFYNLTENLFNQHSFKVIVTDDLKIKKMLDGRIDLIGNTVVAYIEVKHNVASVNKIKSIIISFLDQKEIIKNFSSFELVKIKTRNLHLFKNCPCDFYVYIDHQKYRHYLKENSKINDVVLSNLSEKNIYDIFIEKKDQILFFEQSLKNIQVYIENCHDINTFTKLHILAFMLLGQYLKNIGPTEKISAFILLITTELKEQLPRYKNAQTLINTFPFEHYDLAEKSTFLCQFLFLITKSLAWSSSQSYQKILLSSLLYDLYHQEKQFSLKDQQEPDFYLELNQDQQETFEEHINKSIQLAKYFSNIPESDFIIAYHHCDILHNDSSFQHPLLVSLFFLSNKVIEYLIVYGVSKVSLREILEFLEFKYLKSNHKKAFSLIKESFSN